MSTQQPKEPKNFFKRYEMCSGRVIYTREPTFTDVEMATQKNSTEAGGINSIGFSKEIVMNVILALKRKNGEFVDISNRDILFSQILSLQESLQLIGSMDMFGIDIKKNTPLKEV